MNKEEALDEFIKGLRVAFNNASAYPNRHPYFIKSVEEFKSRIDSLLNFLNPIEVNVAPESLSIGQRHWAKISTYVELARILHQRKIKRIEIKPGLSANELAGLLSALALAPNDIIKSGGLGAILEKAAAKHIFVEELDYSGMLHAQGKEDSRDMWRYLFKVALSSRDPRKINECADDFPRTLRNMRVEEIITDEDLREDLVKFLRCLKENNKEKFSKCSADLFNYLANSPSAVSDKDMKSLKTLFSDSNEDDFARILWSNVSKEEAPDPLFFKLFSTLSEGIGANKIAASLSKNIEPGLLLKQAPLLTKNIQGLLSNPDSQSFSPVYRNTLSSLLKDVLSSGDFYFDPKELKINYCFVLLNMLDRESDPARVKLILSGLQKEWGFISERRDYEYIKYLLQLVRSKKEKEKALAGELVLLEDKISELTEENIWNEAPNAGLDFLAGALDKSRKGSGFYLNKIFEEGKINAYGLGLFFKFFPGELGLFYSGLEAKRNNLEILSRIVKAIAKLGPDLSIPVLERVYTCANEMIRVEILKEMQGMPQVDAGFLLSVLGAGSRALKKEALKALSRDRESVKRGIGAMLEIQNPWGRKNSVILENMSVMEELGLEESSEYLAPFTKKKLFWHAPLKKKAKDILEGLKWKKG